MDPYEEVVAFAKGLRREEIPTEFTCSQQVRDKIFRMSEAQAESFVPDRYRWLTGVPVVIDEDMPDNAWKMVNHKGEVLAEGTL